MREVRIKNATRGTLIGTHIRVAETSLTRLIGLLNRSGLDAGEGLWIQPSSGVHTFFMRFPIDVIGLDRSLRVVKLWPNLGAYRVTSIQAQVRTVLELPTYQIAASNTVLGDTLVLE